MSLYTERLFEEYRRAAKVGKDLMDAAASENRDMTTDEIEQRDRAFDDVTRIKAEIDKAQKADEVAQAADEFRSVAAPIVKAEQDSPSDLDLIRRGFAAVRSGQGYAFESSYTSRSYDPGFDVRALSGYAGTAFNNAFADFVAVYERTYSPMLNPAVVNLVNRTTGAPFIVPRLTADAAGGGTVTAEAAGITETDPTISQVTITPYKFAATNLWSAELDQDNTIGLEALIARSVGRDLGINIGGFLTTGSGSSQPKGFITGATNAGTASGTGTTFGTYFGGTDLISLYYSLAEPYRRVGAWMANSTTLAQIRSSRDTSGQLLWQPSYVLGQPESLLGRPIYENPGMANGSAAKAVAFGDFSAYVVVRVNPVRVDMSRDYKFSSDQIALRTIERVGGDLPDAVAIKYLVNAAV